jgi:intergrase/recombinase
MAAGSEVTGQLSFVDPTQQELRAVAIALILQRVHDLAHGHVDAYAQIRSTKDLMRLARTADDFHFWRRIAMDYKIRIRTAAAVLQRIDRDIRDQGHVLLKRLEKGDDTVPLILEWLKGDKDSYLVAKLRW